MICWWQKTSGKKKKPGINSVQVNKAAFGRTQSSPSYKGDKVSRMSESSLQSKLSVMGTIWHTWAFFVSHEPLLKQKPKQTKWFEHSRLIPGSPWRSAWATRSTGWRSPPDGSQSASGRSRLAITEGKVIVFDGFLGQKNLVTVFCNSVFKNLFNMYQLCLIKLA